MPNGNRIGITYTANVLDVTVTELKQAFQTDNKISGVELPKRIYLGGGNYQFNMEEVLSVRTKLQALKKRGG
jgi:hypothetical protein